MLITSRQFLPYFLTQSLGAFNDNLYRNALILLITYHFATDLGDNTPQMIALCSALFVCPFFLFSATAGRLADKFDKARLIRWLKLTELCVMVCAGLGFYFMHMNLLLAVLFLMGTQSAFFGPVKYAILPSLLEPTELIKGNAWVEAGTFIAILTGTLLGGWLILTAHGRETVTIACISIAAIGVLASRAIVPLPAVKPSLVIRKNILIDTWQTLTYGFKRPNNRRPMLGIAWFWGLGTIMVANLPLYVKDTLGGSNDQTVILLAAFTIGVAIGSFVCAMLLKGRLSIKTVLPGAIGMAAFAADFYMTSQGLSADGTVPIRLIIDLGGIAICAGLFVVPQYALLQHQADHHARGRTLASSNILNAFTMTALSLVGGWQLSKGWLIYEMLTLWVVLTPILVMLIRPLQRLAQNKH